MTRIEFFAPGRPATKGSVRAFRSRGGRMIVKNDNPRGKAWQRSVGAAALAAGGRPLDGPLRVEIEFRLPRPVDQVGTGRNAGRVRASAPLWPAGKPDVDKLQRALLDGLTGVAWRDDAQVVEVLARKVYVVGEGEVGAAVRIEPMEGRAAG